MSGFHHLGTSRQSAEASGFFQWFTLEPVEADVPAPGRRSIHYRPNGPAFHRLTEVVLTCDDQDQLLGVELRLSRAFIEHPQNGLFARDITKSLLRDSISGPDAEQLGALMNEIEFPRSVTVPYLTARSADASIPEVPSGGCEAFLGKRGRWDYRGAGVRLVLENYLREDTPWLRVGMVAR